MTTRHNHFPTTPTLAAFGSLLIGAYTGCGPLISGDKSLRILTVDLEKSKEPRLADAERFLDGRAL